MNSLGTLIKAKGKMKNSLNERNGKSHLPNHILEAIHKKLNK